MAHATQPRTEVKTIGEAADLPLEALLPGGKNRNTRDEEIKSLAASIAAVGLLYPMIVRPNPKQEGTYRIIAGERRWRALKLLKVESAPCLVVPDDGTADAEILRVVENHQRKNLSPLEEALAIRTLLDAGMEAETIARSLGRNRGWLARRSSLAELSTAWIVELECDDSRIGQWPPSHLELIARFPTEVQDKMLERWGHLWRQSVPTLHDLQSVTGQHLRLLSQSPWKLEDETLDPVAGPCGSCPKRSSCAPDLFPEELAEAKGKPDGQDFCLDPGCWRKKAEAFLQRRIESVRVEHPNLLLLNASEMGSSKTLADLFGQPVLEPWEVAMAKKSTPEAVAALVVNGAGLGRIKWVVPMQVAAHGNGRRNGTSGNGSESHERTLQERKEAYDKRRRQYVIDLVKAKVETLAAESNWRNAGQHEGGAALTERGLAAKAICLVSSLMQSRSNGSALFDSGSVNWTDLHALRNHDLGKDVLREALLNLCWQLLRQALERCAHRLLPDSGEKSNEHLYGRAEELIAMLDLDLSDLRAQAAQAIPYAKAWREQVADEW